MTSLYRRTASEKRRKRAVTIFAELALIAAFLLIGAALPASAWDHWGGDQGGTRYSALDQITPANVDNLVHAWEFHTGDLQNRPPNAMARTKFEATPLFVEDSLILCSPFNEVIALDPGTGQQKWRYDPKVSNTMRPGNRYVCRGRRTTRLGRGRVAAPVAQRPCSGSIS